MTMKRLQQRPTPLELIEQLRAFILNAQTAQAGNADQIATVKQLAKELREERKHMQTMLLAVLSDQPVPVSMFKPWASYWAVNKAERDGALTLERRNKKLLIAPSAFFAWFNATPTESKKPKYIPS